MGKELIEDKDKVLIVSVDLGNEKDCQSAVLNLYYNGKNHIIFETTDKEQVAVLNEIMEEEMKKKTSLQRLEQIDNTKSSEALEYLEKFFNSRKIYEPNNTYIFECITCFNSIKQALIKSQEQEKENTRLKEMLINGFRDKNGVFHKQTYLAFIDDEWCICDLKTDEWFLVKEVLECQKD